jgi:arylformamidase
MKIYDISLTINPEMPVWPKDPPVKIERVSKIEDGANANVSHLDMGAHTGTHVDAPFHFLPDGACIESLDLSILVGPVQVVELPTGVNEINAELIQQAGLAEGVTRVLFKTRNSSFWAQGVREFQTEFVGINLDGAQALAARGIRLVGIDYLSVAPYRRSRPTHEVLLKAAMVVVEGLDLSAVPAGFYQLYCLPLKIKGSDGAPARVILVSS